MLVAGGLLAFTVETHGGEGVILGEGLRYAHSAGYVRETIKGAGLALSRLDDLSARNEDNAPVPGLVVVAGKPERPAATGRLVRLFKPLDRPHRTGLTCRREQS